MTPAPATIPLPAGGHLAGDYLSARDAADFAVVWCHGFGSHRDRVRR